MREGLLWFDNDERYPLMAKVNDAVERYRQRFGRDPNCCHTHPDQAFQHPSITIVPDASILRNHFWVGVDESFKRPRTGTAEPGTLGNGAPVPQAPSRSSDARSRRAASKVSVWSGSPTVKRRELARRGVW